jgi:hypothetical protein
MTQFQFPKLIEVECKGTDARLLIDGEEFPYFLGDQGVSTQVQSGEMPSVTLTILADEVRVVDRYKPPPPPEHDWLLLDAKTEAEIGRYSTAARLLEDDIVTTADDKLWHIERIDPANWLLYVVPWKPATAPGG